MELLHASSLVRCVLFLCFGLVYIDYDDGSNGDTKASREALHLLAARSLQLAACSLQLAAAHLLITGYTSTRLFLARPLTGSLLVGWVSRSCCSARARWRSARPSLLRWQTALLPRSMAAAWLLHLYYF